MGTSGRQRTASLAIILCGQAGEYEGPREIFPAEKPTEISSKIWKCSLFPMEYQQIFLIIEKFLSECNIRQDKTKKTQHGWYNHPLKKEFQTNPEKWGNFPLNLGASNGILFPFIKHSYAGGGQSMDKPKYLLVNTNVLP